MSESRYYYLWNIGCQMNRSDAYRVGEQLEQRGFRPTRAGPRSERWDLRGPDFPTGGRCTSSRIDRDRIPLRSLQPMFRRRMEAG